MEELFELCGGLSIYVSADHRFGTDAVLLADYAAEAVREGKTTVCDLCSGCGIVPLLLMGKKPPKRVYGVEIQAEAAELFRKSVEKNGLSEKVIPIEADLTGKLDISEKVDLVTANPPYFRANGGYERLSRAQAIARHELLCDIDGVVSAASKLLKYGGYLKMCNIPERLADVIAAMRRYKIEPKEAIFVSKAAGQPPWLFLIAGKSGAASGMKIKYALTSDFEGVNADYPR